MATVIQNGQPFVVPDDVADDYRKQGAASPEDAVLALDELTVADLRKLADERGLEVKKSASKSELIEVLS